MTRVILFVVPLLMLYVIGATHPWQLQWIPNPCFGARIQNPFDWFDSPGANTGLVFVPDRKAVWLGPAPPNDDKIIFKRFRQ